MGKNDLNQNDQEEQNELTEEQIELLQEQEKQVILNFVDEMSVEELRSLVGDALLELRDRLLFPNNFQVFLFAKNIKILGGINRYVENFLPSLDRMPANGVQGAIALLMNMRNHVGISAENVARIDAALSRLSHLLNSRSGKKRSNKKGRRSKRVKKPTNAALEKDLRFQVGYHLY